MLLFKPLDDLQMNVAKGFGPFVHFMNIIAHMEHDRIMELIILCGSPEYS